MANSPTFFPEGHTPVLADNQWKVSQKILGALVDQGSVSLSAVSTVSGLNGQAVSDVAPYTRSADATSLKVLITNTGDSRVSVSEGGFIVGYLEPYQTWTSPGAGTLALVVTCATGFSSVISIATYK